VLFVTEGFGYKPGRILLIIELKNGTITNNFIYGSKGNIIFDGIKGRNAKHFTGEFNLPDNKFDVQKYAP
jgi:hypothetical protein